MTALSERIQAMDDGKVVRFFDHLGKTLLDNSEVSLDEAYNSVPGEVRAMPEFALIEGMTPDQAETHLPARQSAELARSVLQVMAADASLEPLVEAELNTFTDNKLAVETILAMGFVATMILITATTELKYSNGKLTIKKGQVPVEMITALTSLMEKIALR